MREARYDRHPLKFPIIPRVSYSRPTQADSPAWLVMTHDREHGWLHGDFHAALSEAAELAAGYDVCVQSSAGRWP
jgi:hypothetical protein